MNRIDPHGSFRTSTMGESQIYEFSFDQKNAPWIKEILDRLNSSESKEEELNSTYLIFDGTIYAKKLPNIGMVYVLEGGISVKFCTQCVNSLEPMTDSIETDIDFVFINGSFEKQAPYQDEIELEVDGQHYDLYFYRDNKIDFKTELIDFIDMTKNPYPKVKEFNEIDSKIQK